MTTTDPTTVLDLDAIRARLAEATPGPWGVGNGTDIVRGLEVTGRGSYTCIQSVATVSDEYDREEWGRDEFVEVDPEDDAEFIAAARTDVPLLLAEVDRLRPIADAAQYEYGAQPCIEGDCDHAVEADEDAPEGAPCPLVEIRYATAADVIELTRVRAELEQTSRQLHEAQRDYALRDSDARSQTRALQAALAERDQVRRELAAAEEQIASMRAALDEADAEAVTR